jgi:hypothetical protein
VEGRALDVAEGAFQQSLTLDPNHLKSCLNLSRVLLEAIALQSADRCSIARWRSIPRRAPPIASRATRSVISAAPMKRSTRTSPHQARPRRRVVR